MIATAGALLLAACSGSTDESAKTGSSSAPATVTVTRTATPTPTPTSTPAPRSTTSTGAPALSGFRVRDVTFVGADEWALGTSACLAGRGRCSAIEHSSDGGKVWASLPTPAGAPSSTLARIRFATAKIGYLFSRSRLYLTIDGARHWSGVPGSGGVDALELRGGALVGAYATSSDQCKVACVFGVTESRVGEAPIYGQPLPRPEKATKARIAWSGSYIYLLTVGSPSNGAAARYSVLYVNNTAGDGRWKSLGEPCPETNVPVVSEYVASSDDGAVGVLCEQGLGQNAFVAISTDHGASFRVGSRTVLRGDEVTAFTLANRSTVLVSSDETYRSTDGGFTFTPLSANEGSSPGPASFLGFSSSTVGHAISADGRRLFTTRDAGATWTAYRFS